MQPYRRVLAIPGMPTATLLMLVARLPMTAMGITLTLHVVSELGRGYGAAGLVGTATTVGTAMGAPLVGRMIDRYGLRPVVAVCGTASTLYWLATPHLSYAVLLAVALPAGILIVPASSISRQIISAKVPPPARRTAFAMDTISIEASFMVGPAAGILISTRLSSTVALTGIGIAFGLVAVALYVLNPPIRGVAESAPARGSRPPIRTWLTGRMAATLLIACGALFVLIGTELAALAALRDNGEVAWTGVVIAVMCVASLTGGLVHGAVHRSLPQLPLMVLLAVLVIPVGLFDQPWWLLALALIPMNLVCAPTLSATTEAVSELAPPGVRGEAMGLQDSATRIGMALGAPAVGFVMDHSSAAWGFAAAGIGGLALAAVGGMFKYRDRRLALSRESASLVSTS